MGSLSFWADVFSIVGAPANILAWWQLWRIARRKVRQGVDKGKWVVVVLLAFSTGIWLVYAATYFGLVKDFRHQDDRYYSNNWVLSEGAEYKPEIIVGRHFLNQTVVLDGREYRNCTFTNVTFVYEGSTPIRFGENKIFEVRAFDSHNQAIQELIGFFRVMEYFSPTATFLPPAE